MADKKTSSTQDDNKADKANENVDSGIAQEAEEVEAELVTEEGQPVGDSKDTTGETIEVISSEGDTLEEQGGLVQDETSGAGKGISPGIVFLSMLGLIGAIAAGLWAVRAGQESASVTTERKVDPLEQIAVSEEKSNAEKSPDNGAVDQKSTATTKVTNKIDNTVKTAAASIDTTDIPADKKVKLPAAPVTGGSNNKLQQSAKEAAKALAPKNLPAEVSVDKTAAAAVVAVQTQAQETTDKLVAETKAVGDEVIENVTDIATDEATKKTNQAVQENLVEVINVKDPVSEAADLFASDPGAAETPEDQLGADPIAAIESLQKQAEEQYTESTEETVDVLDVAVGNAEEKTQISAKENTTTAENVEVVVAEEIKIASENEGSVAETKELAIEEVRAEEIETLVATNEPTEPAEETVVDKVLEASDDTQNLPATAPITTAASPTLPQPSTQEVEEKFAGEIAALEESFEERTSLIANALDEEKARATEQAEEIASLKQNLDEALKANQQRNNTEISRLRRRIDQLQKTEEKQASSTERQTAGLLALISLQRSFDQGVPYRRELGVLQKALPNAVDYSGLSVNADNGAPTIVALQERFPEAIRTTITGSRKSAKGPVGHALRNLQSLFSVRPASPQEGDSITAIISRAEDKFERDDLGATLSELDALGGGASEEMSLWITDARKRYEATKLLSNINDSLLAGIGN